MHAVCNDPCVCSKGHVARNDPCQFTSPSKRFRRAMVVHGPARMGTVADIFQRCRGGRKRHAHIPWTTHAALACHSTALRRNKCTVVKWHGLSHATELCSRTYGYPSGAKGWH